MKTTLEIPDPIFRRAKSAATERGIPLREFVTEAVRQADGPRQDGGKALDETFRETEAFAQRNRTHQPLD